MSVVSIKSVISLIKKKIYDSMNDSFKKECTILITEYIYENNIGLKNFDEFWIALLWNHFNK